MTFLADIRFGPAGYPAAAKGRVSRVFSILNDVNLTALEYAAVYGLRMGLEKAEMIGDLARDSGITMSMHAPYYISLASKKQDIRERSKGRLMKALQFAPLMNAKRIVFHAGGYSGLSQEEAYAVVRDSIEEIWEKAGHLGNGAILMAETAGKMGAFGSVDELIRLCQDVDGCLPTIDWAHLYARSNGKIDDRKSYLEIIGRFEDQLGNRFVDNMHFHVSGITYTKRGEKSHRPMGGKWGPEILPLMQIVKEVGYTPTFISEAPNSLEGALYTKHLFEALE
ncbi:MAG: TIM barrel protein [Candidatus Thorarchaeota archaeon]|jgi:deoxyribonuclease-4